MQTISSPLQFVTIYAHNICIYVRMYLPLLSAEHGLHTSPKVGLRTTFHCLIPYLFPPKLPTYIWNPMPVCVTVSLAKLEQWLHYNYTHCTREWLSLSPPPLLAAVMLSVHTWTSALALHSIRWCKVCISIHTLHHLIQYWF